MVNRNNCFFKTIFWSSILRADRPFSWAVAPGAPKLISLIVIWSGLVNNIKIVLPIIIIHRLITFYLIGHVVPLLCVVLKVLGKQTCKSFFILSLERLSGVNIIYSICINPICTILGYKHNGNFNEYETKVGFTHNSIFKCGLWTQWFTPILEAIVKHSYTQFKQDYAQLLPKLNIKLSPDWIPFPLDLSRFPCNWYVSSKLS